MSQAGRAIRKWWWTVPAVVALLIGAAAAYLYYWSEAIQARIRRGITQELQERFHSDVELADLQIKLVPRLNVTGHNLRLRYHGREDIPPLIQIASFSLSSGYLELLVYSSSLVAAAGRPTGLRATAFMLWTITARRPAL